MDKESVIQTLEEIGILLELKGENPFKVRAYHNGARVLEGQPEDLAALIETGRLEELKGIGEALSEQIRELFKTGRLTYYEKLKKSFPAGLFEMFRIPGLGPKRIKILYDKLKLKSVAGLEKACRGNRLLKLEGFGEKTEENILRGIEQLKKSSGQFLFAVADSQAGPFAAYLKKQGGVRKIEVAGSLRRRREVVKDIDLLVTTKDPAKVHHAFIRYPLVENVIAHGDTKSSVRLKSGINCDLRTVSEKEFPFALYYFTGSREHNVAVRTIAKRAGYKINEYGLFKGNRSIPCKDEAEILKKLGFDYIPPELREGGGELEAAKGGGLPALVEEEDIRGVFHVHSTYSDGVASLEDMIASAQGLGYALLENVVMQGGQMANPQLTNYIIPTSLDTPPMSVEIVEKPYRHGPFGAKGVGELPMDAPAPAVAAAVFHATGRLIPDLPILPERILHARLHDQAERQ